MNDERGRNDNSQFVERNGMVSLPLHGFIFKWNQMKPNETIWNRINIINCCQEKYRKQAKTAWFRYFFALYVILLLRIAYYEVCYK